MLLLSSSSVLSTDVCWPHNNDVGSDESEPRRSRLDGLLLRLEVLALSISLALMLLLGSLVEVEV